MRISAMNVRIVIPKTEVITYKHKDWKTGRGICISDRE